MHCSRFDTGYGPGAVYADDKGVVRVEIPDMSHCEKALQTAEPEFQRSELSTYAALQLKKYFNGERIDFSDIPLSLDEMTLFRRDTLTIVRNISFGEVVSYRQVALMCGSPHAARAIGGALAANPVPIIIPCHRVVASDGRLTGFSAPGGKLTKLALLKLEGVEFKGLFAEQLRVVMHRSMYR